MKLLFATQNKNKVLEVQQIIGDHHEINTLHEMNFDDELPETQDTLEANAREKVNFIYQKFGINCFAEDSGLEIDSLNGEPGAFSARYAGDERSDEKNIQLVLERLRDQENRSAKFRTVIALVINDKEFLYEGIIRGQITKSPSGEGGFGYDPIFVPDGYDKTFAELGLNVKTQISHRAKAFLKLKDFLESDFAFV